MEEVLNDPTHLSKGINLREMMSSGSEFHIDLDFKKKAGMGINIDDDLFADDQEESDSEEDVLKLIEQSTEKKMLSSPEYLSFEDLSKKMIDCDPGGNVKLLILEEGEGPLVSSECEVLLHYAAYWEKASIPFDSTLTMNAGQPVRLPLGCGRMIPGLELGLLTVKGPQARFLLLLQPAAAWGQLAAPPRVLPQPALFVIVLYEVRDVGVAVRFNDLPSSEQTKYEVTYRAVTSLHSQAKDFYKKRKFTKAINNYQQSITILNVSRPQSENEEGEVKRLKVNSYLNLAVCYSKIDKPKYIIRMLECLDYIIDIERNCKALFYYGKAYEMLGKTDESIKYYQKALLLEPKNKDIGKALDNLDFYLKKSNKNEKKMWRSVFKKEDDELGDEIDDKLDVDDEFRNGVKDLFDDLSKKEEFAKFQLPPNLKSDEIDCVKRLAEDFEGIKVFEEGEGRRKRVTIVKTGYSSPETLQWKNFVKNDPASSTKP